MHDVSDENSLTRWDAQFLRYAVLLGQRNLGRTWPNPSVGAVIVSYDDRKNPIIVGIGITQPGGRPHAERILLEKMNRNAENCTLYVSLEPCSHHGKTPPCVDIIIESGIKRVVSAMKDPDNRVSGRGFSILKKKGIEVVEELPCNMIPSAHEGHISRITRDRPFVTAKLAQSADGYVGKRGKGQIQISSQQMKNHVHMLRAQSDAILVGIGTVLCDDPELTVRLPGMEAYSPVRIILDTHLNIPLASKLVSSARSVPVWVICCEAADKSKMVTLRQEGVEVIISENSLHMQRIDPASCLKILAKKGITSLLCEGGPHIISSFMNADIIDRFILNNGSIYIGSDGIPSLSQADQLFLLSNYTQITSKTIGMDTMQIYERTQN